jgi:hypothetical protein
MFRTSFKNHWLIWILFAAVAATALYGAVAGAGGGKQGVALPGVVPLDEDLAFGPKLLFVQQDQVTAFPPDGSGLREGTVRGAITGTSVTNFQFIPTGPTEFFSDELSLFTDVDGDQILFHVKIDGRFVTPLTGDPVADFPGRENLSLIAGIFSGVYEAVKATGKYQALLGRKFPAKGIATTPARNPAIGASYMEIYSDQFQF